MKIAQFMSYYLSKKHELCQNFTVFFENIIMKVNIKRFI